MKKAIRGGRGLTLIELVTCVAILSVFVAVGMPYFNETIVRQRGRAAVERVATDLRYAQSKAVRLGALYALHSGGDSGKPGMYRLERSTDGGASWTPDEDKGIWYSPTQDYTNAGFQDMKDNLGTGTTLNRVVFDSKGVVTASPAAGSYPVGINVTTPSEGIKTVFVMRTGAIRIP
jgi:prepilin-type N-terminal cleavage/methylation domain-containing protein